MNKNMNKNEIMQMLLKINLFRANIKNNKNNEQIVVRLDSIIYDLNELLNILPQPSL